MNCTHPSFLQMLGKIPVDKLKFIIAVRCSLITGNAYQSNLALIPSSPTAILIGREEIDWKQSL